MSTFKNKYILLSILIATTLFSCQVQKSNLAIYPHKTTCVSTSLDGKHLVKTYGCGKNQAEILFAAQKNAIRDIVFFGVNDGKNKKLPPLVTDVKTRLKSEVKLDNLLSEKSELKEQLTKVMNTDIAATGHNKDSKLSQEIVYGILVQVNTPKLMQLLNSN